MPVVIRKLRAQLRISLDDLGVYLGIVRSRVHAFEQGRAFERGEVREKLNLLAQLTSESQKSKVKNSWIDDKDLQDKASQWYQDQQRKSVTTAKEYGYRLKEMKDEYSAGLKALDLLEAIGNSPECTSEIKQWIKVVAPRIAKKTLENGPDKQAKLQLRQKEALGRSR